jgi:transposase
MTLLELRCKPSVVVGVDTHKETHHAAVLGEHGALLEVREFPADTAGYAELTDWIEGFGQVGAVGIESTGSYGAGLTRFLRERSFDVREINQPHHHTKARVGKDDAIDAEAAARKVLSGSSAVTPKDTTGIVESIRMLQVARRSAVKSRTIALNQFQGVLVTAPATLRESIKGRWTRVKVRQCAVLRPDLDRLCEPLQAAKVALRSICRRIQDLDEEIALLDVQLHQLVKQCCPSLLGRVGIGVQHAAQLIVTAGENLDRLDNEAAFARLCGVAPVPASSGKTRRMRLHKGGDRQANRALHLIVVVRLRYDERTRNYMARRTQEGLSKRDVMRCLKRFVAREVFGELKRDLLLGVVAQGPATHLA